MAEYLRFPAVICLPSRVGSTRATAVCMGISRNTDTYLSDFYCLVQLSASSAYPLYRDMQKVSSNDIGRSSPYIDVYSFSGMYPSNFNIQQACGTVVFRITSMYTV
jgi:hypothetical protein